MLNTRNSGLSLLELIVVVLVVGILATLAIPSFTTMQERSYDQEAKASLKLIKTAQKIYQMEVGGYYASTAPHEQNLNTYLRLSLTTAANRNWNYQVTANNGVSPQASCSQATRNAVAGRTLRLRNSEDDAVTGTCP